MRIKSKFVIFNLIIMLCFWGLATTTNKYYGSEYTSEISNSKESEDISIETDALREMSLDEIAMHLDPNENKQDFIVIDSLNLKLDRGLQVTSLYSGYNLSTFNKSLYGKFALYKINGKYVYCVEPTSDLVSIANKVPLSKNAYNKFPSNTKKYIEKSISSAVSKYNETNNTDYLFAGQLLIWEHLSSVYNTPSNPWTINAVEEFTDEINEIKDEVKDWNKIPSFLSRDSSKPKVHTLKYDVKSDTYSITLKDNNGVWDAKFANYSDFGTYKVTNPSGTNNVKISISAENLKLSKTQEYTWSTDMANTSEFYDANQDLVYVGAPEVNGYMAFKTEKKPLGGFRISKVNYDTNELLAGVEFSLYDSNGMFIRKYTTNSEGIIDTGLTLVPGTYSLIETRALAGFVVNDTNYSVTTFNGEITDYTKNPIKNVLIKGGFELNKVGVESDGSQVPLANVEFTVTSSTYPDFKKVYVTNKNGQIKTAKNELKYGSYHIEETKPQSKYIGDFKQDFEISENQQIIKLNSNKPIENYLYVNKVKITKIAQSLDNADLEEYPLAGTKFKIYREASPADGNLDEDDVLIEEITTKEDGFAVSNYMSAGKYLVEESYAPIGYELTDEVYSFTINKNSGVPNQTIIELDPITNEVIMGRALLTKVGVKSCGDDVCQTPLDKVSFGVYEDNQTTNDADPIEIIETDEEGIAMTSDLKYGKYYVKEIENNHENYILSDTIYRFEISQMDEVVEINDGYPIENEEKLGQVNITKTGQSLENGNEEIVVLADAEYTIYDTDKNIVDTLVTDEFGKAQSIALSFGEYTIKETRAPSGYVLDTSVYNFEIGDEAYLEPLNLKFADQVITNEVYISKIDIVTNSELEGAKLEVYDREKETVVQSWTSTKEPYIFTLKTGKYEICETIAPIGYSRMLTCKNFEVNEHGVVQRFEIENKPLSITATGNNIFTLIIKLTAVILGLLTIKFIYRFKNNTRI